MASKNITKIHTIVQTNKRASGTVLFFHGSGDTGKGIKDWIRFVLGKELSFPHLRVLFPTAPLRPYTPNNGDLSNVWFDRLSISPDVPEHKETIESIGDEVKKIVKSEIEQGIKPERIIIGGFSMGGALALHSAYRFYPQVAGAFTLSSFLNETSTVYDHLKSNGDALKCPLFMCHGNRDSLVDLSWGQNTFQELKKLGVNGEFHVIPNAMHELKKNEVLKLIDWIQKILPPLESDTS